MQYIKLNGYDITVETMVIVNAWAITMDSTSWDQPKQFKRERLLDNSIDFKGQDFQFIRFGSGRKGYLRTMFGIAIIKLMLANLVHQFDWTLLVGEDLDLFKVGGLTIHKKYPLMAIATPYRK